MSAVLPANDTSAEGSRLAQILGRLMPALLERQGALLAVKDASTGRYEHVNAAMAALFGTTPAHMTGRTDAELVDAALATTLRAAEQTALAQPGALASEHKFELRGARHEFAVLRLAVGPDAAGVRRLCSVWTDQSATQAERRAAARGARTARAAAARQRAAAPRAAGPGAARRRHRPVHPRPLRRPAAARGRPVDARAPRVRAGVDRARPAAPTACAPLGDDGAHARARGAGPAAARQHARDGRLVPPRRRAFRGAAVGRRPGHRAFAHGRPAPPVRHADRGARRRRSSASRCRWAWPAFRTPRRRRKSCWRPATRRLAEARRRGGNHVDAGQHPLRAGLTADRPAAQARQPL